MMHVTHLLWQQRHDNYHDLITTPKALSVPLKDIFLNWTNLYFFGTIETKHDNYRDLITTSEALCVRSRDPF